MAEDWRDSFQPWSRSAGLAHPDSPAGGSGNGFSRSVGYADYSWSKLPHPDSPAGRRANWESELRRKTIIADRSAVEKLKLAIERALPKLPRKTSDKVRAMLTPEALGTMAAIAAVWGASHWIGVGEAVDVILLGWGVWTLGSEALDVARDLCQFVTAATRAQNDEDIDQAADCFARAIAVIGVDGLAAILAHKAFKTFKGTRPKGAPAPQEEVAPTPREDAAAFSKPPAEPKERIAEPEEAKPSLERVIAQRRAAAQDFYRSQGLSEKAAADHMQGIDFTKPVEVETLKPGTLVSQWQRPGRPQGNYYAPPGTDPATLGINPAGRLETQYVVTQPVQVLKSTAADIPDWEGSGASFKGGGSQYFTTIGSAFGPK